MWHTNISWGYLYSFYTAILLGKQAPICCIVMLDNDDLHLYCKSVHMYIIMCETLQFWTSYRFCKSGACNHGCNVSIIYEAFQWSVNSGLKCYTDMIICGPSCIGQASTNSPVLYKLPTTIVTLLTLVTFNTSFSLALNEQYCFFVLFFTKWGLSWCVLTSPKCLQLAHIWPTMSYIHLVYFSCKMNWAAASWV